MMKVLQINAIYGRLSTGRTTKELHEYLQNNGIDSYVASPELNGLTENSYKIGNVLDHKIHALESRIWGLQGYFSHIPTIALIQYMETIAPDVVILRNLHGNYVNLPMLLKYIAKKQIATILVLHDCWFFTGKCPYYIEDNCDRWLSGCGNCPAMRKGNPSFFFDQSEKMYRDKKMLFSRIEKLAVVGVSRWVAEDAKLSLLKNARKITYIYNWIDLKQFRPKQRMNERFTILGVAASWSQLKGIDVFYALAEMVPENVRIILIGEYSHLEVKPANIEFVGPVHDVAQLAEYYADADVFVNPSIQETFGKTTAEALASGTPVIAYKGTATPELIGEDGKCGYLVCSMDAKDYLKCIEKIMDTGSMQFSEACRKRAELLFEKETNIQQYLELCKELVDDNG